MNIECRNIFIMFLLIVTEQNNWFAVAVGEKIIWKYGIVEREFSQSELLLKEINQMLSTGTKRMDAFSRPNTIFVVNGPGDFSALRVGVATANALGFAWGAGVIGVKPRKQLSPLTKKEKIEKYWEDGVKQAGQGGGARKFKEAIVPFYDKEPNIAGRK